MAQSNAKGVLQFCSTHLPQLHLVNLSTALHRVAKASDRLDVLGSTELQALIRCVSKELMEATEVPLLTVASVSWACAKLSYLDMPLFDAMAGQAVEAVQALQARAQEAGFQECANIAWAYAMLELFHGPLLEALQALAVELMPAFDVQAVSNMVWALAKLLALDEPLMTLSAARFLEHLAESTPQNRSNFCWAYALLLVHSPRLASLAHDLGSLESFELQDLTNTAWAFVSLKSLGLSIPLSRSSLGSFFLTISSEAVVVQRKEPIRGSGKHLCFMNLLQSSCLRWTAPCKADSRLLHCELVASAGGYM